MTADLAALRTTWNETWPQALAAWGRFTRLRPPRLLPVEASDAAGTRPGRPADTSAPSSFAWFNLRDVEVSIDLDRIVADGLEGHELAILAHEIGHHVYAPGDLLTAGRMTAQARLGLVDRDPFVPVIVNLWSDLLINDRLQTRADLDMAGVYRTFDTAGDPLMTVCLRACEILWSLPPGDLCGPGPHPEGEALLVSRLVRAYATDPVGGVGGFAMVARQFLPEAPQPRWCAHQESVGAPVPGLATDPTLTQPPVHPARDPRIVGSVAARANGTPPAQEEIPTQSSGSNTLSPADYTAVLQALGTATTPLDAAIAWYREHASRHLVPFPVRRHQSAPEDLLGGHDVWDIGDDLADVDWTATMMASPHVVPGMTTRRRHYETEAGAESHLVPVDLDIYLDSSGSMPDPVRTAAPIALAGAILALSALRTGARVQATTWSGPTQIAGTDGFTRDPRAVLTAIVSHFGGGTAFPVQILEQTHLDPPRSAASARPCHVAVISDSGVITMFTDGSYSLPPEFDPALTRAARAVQAAGGGGTLVLNVHDAEPFRRMAQGYDVYAVDSWDAMTTFATDFARTLWGNPA